MKSENREANNFMTANYEHQQFLEYEDYVCKSEMFEQNNMKSTQKSGKKVKTRKVSRGNKKSRNGSNRSLSRSSSINYKKEDKINKFVSYICML